MARAQDLPGKRLKDRVRLPVRALLVGINPGVRSAEIGHPGGRNANYTYADMLAAFRALRAYLARVRDVRSEISARR